MTKRPLIALALILAAAATQAHARSPIAPVAADPLGPRSNPTPTVGEAVARVQIEKSGYTGVRGLSRTADGSWHAMARNARNAPVAVALDSQGRVTEAQTR
ncbi:MAG: hypothetical protein ACREUF_07225 [Solimonas sp.]